MGSIEIKIKLLMIYFIIYIVVVSISGHSRPRWAQLRRDVRAWFPHGDGGGDGGGGGPDQVWSAQRGRSTGLLCEKSTVLCASGFSRHI